MNSRPSVSHTRVREYYSLPQLSLQLSQVNTIKTLLTFFQIGEIQYKLPLANDWTCFVEHKL